MEKEIGWLLQEKYDGKMTAAAKKDIERLKAGEPLDHIIGFIEFLGCKILVGPDVLIPRVETEFWVEKALRAPAVAGARVLDMFAGSGCIGISVMRHMRNAHVTFADSEKSALVQIKKSLKLNRLGNSCELVHGDVFENVKGKFDYIFANPPYIPTKNRKKIQRSVINHEPHAALFGGTDGLKFIKRFLSSTKNRLNSGGKIFMEFDPPQKNNIAALLKKYGYRNWQFHKDQYEKWRWVEITAA